MSPNTHDCKKESEIAEIKQLVKSFSGNERHIYENWHDVRMLEEKQAMYEKQIQELQSTYNEQHKETLQLIKEINECQQKLIVETVKTNKTFEDLKIFLAAIPIFCTVLTFIIEYIRF